MRLAKVSGVAPLVVVGVLLLSACAAEAGPIVFTSNRDGSQAIYLVTPDGEKVTRLAKTGEAAFSPVWSPDHKRVAFLSQQAGTTDLFMVEADGENLTRLTNSPAIESRPRWSPDGGSLAFLSQAPGKEPRLFVMSLEDRQAHRLTFGSQPDMDHAWSPGGKWIAYSVEDASGENQGLFLRNPGGVNTIRLTAQPDTRPAWSPDGKRIVFQSRRDGNLELYLLPGVGDEPGGEPVRLTDDPAPDYSAAWSPNGDWIAFISERDGNPEVYIIRPDGSRLTRLTINSATEEDPVWSQDNRLAFVSDVNGNADVFVMDADGENQLRLTFSIAADFEPSW